MSAHRRITSAIGANSAAQLLTLAIQIGSVPALLSIWSIEIYGQWLILTAIPAYISLSDLGILTIATNKMSMFAATGDKERANTIFNTAIKFCIISGISIVFLAASLLWLLDLNESSRIVLLLLITSSIIALNSGLIDAAYRSAGQYATGIYLTNTIRLCEWIGMLFGALIGKDFISAAVGNLAGRLAAFLLVVIFSRKKFEEYYWGIKFADSRILKEMLAPSISFLAFPVANAISIQGMTLIVGSMFGPVFLVTFNSYRTISRSLIQAITIVGKSLWPEITRQYSTGNIERVIKIIKVGTLTSFMISAAGCTILYFLGRGLLEVWTSGKVDYIPELFALFLASTLATSLWQMGMVALSATNNHSRLSAVYLAAAIFSLAFVYISSQVLGSYSAIAAAILFEIIVIFAVGFELNYLKHHRAFR